MSLRFRQQADTRLSLLDIIDSPRFSLVANCIAHDKTVAVKCSQKRGYLMVELEEAYTDPERAEDALGGLRVRGNEDEWFELLYPSD